MLYASYGIQQTSITDGETYISGIVTTGFWGTSGSTDIMDSPSKAQSPVPKFRLEWSYILSPQHADRVLLKHHWLMRKTDQKLKSGTWNSVLQC